jgi:hypothetical protein
MTQEQIEKAIEFIISSQAQSEIRQARNDEQISKVSEQLALLTANVARLANEQATGFQELREAQAQTTKNVESLLKAQGRMDARLDSFMNEVEKFIQESRNGKK